MHKTRTLSPKNQTTFLPFLPLLPFQVFLLLYLLPMPSSCGPTGCGLPLTTEQQYVLYSKGTEAPFTSPLNDEHRKGIFVAADTGEPLFRSEDKFNSGTGWPSFTQPISADAVVLHEDGTLGMTRTEVTTKGGSHLGHVFDYGPEPTGKRFCINGSALRFVAEETKAGK